MSTAKFGEDADDDAAPDDDVDEVDIDEVDVDELPALDADVDDPDGDPSLDVDAVDDLEDDDDDEDDDLGADDDDDNELAGEDDDEDDEDDEEEEESLDVLLAREKVLDEDDLGRIADEPRDVLSVRPALVGAGEFTCRSCFLVKRRAQLANEKRLLCFDCA